MSDNVVHMPPPEGAPAPSPKTYGASIYSNKTPLPSDFVELITNLEHELDMPVWMIIQHGDDEDWDEIGERLYAGFVREKGNIDKGKPAGLLLHSPGGLAEEAYKIVRLFQRRDVKITTIIPRYAKSAATIMALGGSSIMIGCEAELGPLDVQIYDLEDGQYDSALNAVQSLERLNAYALTALDQAMTLFIARTRKRPDALLPLALQYATSMIGPLVGKIDSVALTKKSRDLKVAEDYAVRLMKAAGYSFSAAKRIAGVLVERYSTHGFVIDRAEAKSYERVGPTEHFGLGLNVVEPNESVEDIFDALSPHLEKLTVIGRIKEIGHEQPDRGK
jgi:hypothetical protein